MWLKLPGPSITCAIFLCKLSKCKDISLSKFSITPIRPEDVKNSCFGSILTSSDISAEMIEPAKIVLSVSYNGGEERTRYEFVDQITKIVIAITLEGCLELQALK